MGERMVFDLLLLRQVILLAGCGLAAYTDARTGLILDRITYPMIALGILLNLVEWNWFGLGLGAFVFALGYGVYYMGKVGGGDVKLFAGIAFLLPFLGGQVFLLNALFAACILAVVFYSAYYVSSYARQGIEWKENMHGIKRAVLFGLALSAWLAVASFTGLMHWEASGFLTLPLLLALLFLAFEKGIRKKFFLEQVSVNRLEEDEVIAEEFLEEKIRKGLGLGVKGVFGEREVKKLKEMHVKHVPVYRRMPPFGPFILLGCIAALAQPNLLSLLFA